MLIIYLAMNTQRISIVRRNYNSWVADETLEDYALRYTPRGFRKLSEFRVANTAFGAVSFLALEAIGGYMAISYGFTNALWAILAVSLITFLTAWPISVYAARHGLDMDLLSRGAGFGYLGSTVTSLIYASFTFIFFAIEAAIMALALELYFGWPIMLCYLLSSLVVIPLVTYGITVINRIQWWTQPLWLVLLVSPFIAVALRDPQLFLEFTQLAGRISGDSDFNWQIFGIASTAAFALVVQVGEQVDFLRFMPERTQSNRVRWWAGVLIAGPGWIIPGALKMLAGAFLAFLALQVEISPEKAVEPTQMYLAGFGYVFENSFWALTAMALFVIVSQVKINITNAYAGSLAWSNFFARLTHHHPGRVVWLVFNVAISLLLMSLGVFQALERVLGWFSIIGVAWVGALVADLVINKPLGLSPSGIEFRRAHLYDINPVGFGAMIISAAVGMLAYGGLIGSWIEPFAPFLTLGLAIATTVFLAVTIGPRYYLARADKKPWSPGEIVECGVCHNHFESEDMAHCPAYSAPICSLCCTLESRCLDRCKSNARATDQLRQILEGLLPAVVARKINTAIAHYLMLFGSMALLLAVILVLIYLQQSAVDTIDINSHQLLRTGFIKAFAVLLLVSAIVCWWIVLSSESRRMAQEESDRQNQLLQNEITAHQRTDAELQRAKNIAESASQAKTRYVAGLTHELRTPLNSILGYTQILRKNLSEPDLIQRALDTIDRSGHHMTELIDGVLDLARIEAGRLQLERAPLALEPFLEEVMNMVSPQAQAKGLRCEFRSSGRLPTYVQTDAKRLRQVLINLLSNAVRFTHTGGVTLHLDYRREVARFEVIDTGIGIPPEDLDRIFLPFERSKAGRQSNIPGTGLGLTITHLLIELMGGEITVHSTLGQGSTFIVRLYLPEIAVPLAEIYPRHRALWRIRGYIGERHTLLIVDDQPVQRQLLAAMLMPLGFILREAGSGRECLNSVVESPPDAVLLDLTMDDPDGWTTADRLRQAGYSGPVLIVSANVFENQPRLLQLHDVQGFIGKPVLEGELLDWLERYLQIEWVEDYSSRANISNNSPQVDRKTFERAPTATIRLALRRAAKLGHLQGLHNALQQWAQDEPDHSHNLTWIRCYQWVESCDAEAVLLYLDQLSDDTDDGNE